MDAYREGEKVRIEEIAGPNPANDGFDAAEEELRENAERYGKRFERWHGVKDGSDL